MRGLWVFLISSAITLALAGNGLAENGDTTTATPQAKQALGQATADRIFYQEAKLVESMHKFTPLVETYIQNLKPDAELGAVPNGDQYFLGRLVLDKRGLSDKAYETKKAGVATRLLDRLNSFYRMNYVPTGFMQLVFLDSNFDKNHYELKPLRQQFLGEVRTTVFDVVPKGHFKGPHFVGRIWVEDQDNNIVRINGTYEPRTRSNFFFHFDSWRMNIQPGLWLPAYVYTEETNTKYMFVRKLTMKGQTRLWGYKLNLTDRPDEFAAIEVNQGDNVKDVSDSAPNEYNPVRSQHMWEREAEDNVLDRLERAGVLAPDGDVSKVLQTVVNNLEITNNLNIVPDVRCRVLLTTPLESFTIGHTIVLSRGLLDVLPDEASLAMVLAHELAHISLGHRIDTRYAFSDRMIFPDEDTFLKIAVARSDREEDDADKKAVAFLKASPYADKVASAALFLKSLQERSADLKWLISPQFGNRMAKGRDILRMEALLPSAPALKESDVKQLPALPLGSRVKLDPWSDQVAMEKGKPEPLLSARDKMEFEVTPVYPNLVRFNQPTEVSANTALAK